MSIISKELLKINTNKKARPEGRNLKGKCAFIGPLMLQGIE